MPRVLLCWLQKKPVSQSCIFILWATRHAAEKPSLAYRCCPFVPPSISITKTLFSHHLGSLTQPLLQIPCSHGEWETRGWQSFSFPLQRDALLVLRRGQLWSCCCDASLALAYSRGHPKQWSRRGERGELTATHRTVSNTVFATDFWNWLSKVNLSVIMCFFYMPGRYKWIFGLLIIMYNIWICFVVLLVDNNTTDWLMMIGLTNICLLNQFCINMYTNTCNHSKGF